MTTQIGYTGGSGFNDWANDGSKTQAWLGTFGIGGTTTLGRMVQVDAYAAANSGGGTGGAVAWVGGQPSIFTTADAMAAGSGTTAAWHTKTGDVPTTNSDVWEFGFACTNGIWCVYIDGGGTTKLKANAITDTSGGTNVNAYTGRTGSLGGYGTFFVVETYVRRSGSWVKALLKVRRSGAWNSPPIYIRRGSGWTQVGHLVRRNELDWKRELDGKIIWPDGSWEPALLRWDYDRPRYIGVGHPEDKAWKHLHDGIVVPKAYRLAA